MQMSALWSKDYAATYHMCWLLYIDCCHSKRGGKRKQKNRIKIYNGLNIVNHKRGWGGGRVLRGGFGWE